MGHEFLCDHSRNTKHGQPTIAQFLVLERPQTFWVFGLQSKRVETIVVSKLATVFERGDSIGYVETLCKPARLQHCNRSEDEAVESLQRWLLERRDRGGRDVATKKRMEFLSKREANSRQHSNATVLQFGLTEISNLLRRRWLGRP